MTSDQPISPTTILLRGWRKRCPACGSGSLFEQWYTLRPECGNCQFDLHAMESHTWAFMYLSTAFFTGLIVVAMLLITPADLLLGRLLVAVTALGLIVGSLPRRKGLGIAVEYLLGRGARPNGGASA